MKQKIRVIISIVISAVLLGLAVVYCMAEWMPVDAQGWILWCVSAILCVSAIYRIANLAKMLGDKDKE